MVETVQIGRLTLHEDFPAALSSSADGGFSLSGIEFADTLTPDQTRRIVEDIRTLGNGAVVPVYWNSRPEQALYCRVASVSTSVARYATDANVITWSVDLERLGSEYEVDIESRISGPLTRNTNFAVTGERWDAPPIGHYAYWTGATIPSVVVRTGSDGAMTVYRDIPATSPRWGCAPIDFPEGRVRFLDDTLRERPGAGFTVTPTDWELTNGHVRVTPTTLPGELAVAAFTGGSWQTKLWTISTAGTPLPLPKSVTVLHNDFHEVSLRILYASAPGRFTVDVSLRRGSRFTELYVQGATSSTLAVKRSAVEAATAATGYIRATANDGVGNRYIVGSAHTHTQDLVNGGISLAATTKLDAFVGVIAGGSAAVAGDQAADIYEQYLGTPGEVVAAVRR
jgi:hypothetical protein